MATSTFERKIVISDTASQKRLMRVLNSNAPAKPLAKPPFSAAERNRSERRLTQYFSRFKP
ncbi:MAG: hypothetical protein RR843_07100 [Clostridia bacterium]